MHTGNRQTLLQVSWVLTVAFLLLLTLLHFVKPEFDPGWRVISEYEIGRYGWLMRLAFFCWGGGCLLLTLSLWRILLTIGGSVGKWWLLIISLCLFGAGIFAPQPITDLVRGPIDRYHGIAGAVTIFTFPIASTLIAGALSKQQAYRPLRKTLFALTVLVWVGIAVFFGVMMHYSEHAKTRDYGPDVLIGLPNRFMVLTYTIWLIAVARRALRLNRQ